MLQISDVRGYWAKSIYQRRSLIFPCKNWTTKNGNTGACCLWKYAGEFVVMAYALKPSINRPTLAASAVCTSRIRHWQRSQLISGHHCNNTHSLANRSTRFKSVGMRNGPCIILILAAACDRSMPTAVT
jgi:hypothetical protein